MTVFGYLARCLRCAVEALRAPAPGNDPAIPERSPAPPALPRTPRPIKWLWAAGLTGAVAAELAANSTGPGAQLLREFLRSAGTSVRVRPPVDPAGVDCVRCCSAADGSGAAAEAGPSNSTPANQSIPRPAGGP